MSIKYSRIRRLSRFILALALAGSAVPIYADPWSDSVIALQTVFTGPIARGLSLVAVVVGGLTFAFEENGSHKRMLAGIIFGVGMAVGAVNFLSWLFPG